MTAQPHQRPPLPRLRVLPVPDSSPPLADPTDVRPLWRPSVARHHQEKLALDLVVAGVPPTARHLAAPGEWDDPATGPRRTATADLPAVEPWAARLCLALLEIGQGNRPVVQAMRWTSPAVYESLVRRQSRALRRANSVRQPTHVRRVTACHPEDGVAEVSVVVVQGGRGRAVAMRLEGLDRRWVLSSFEVG